jgi:predicted nuclease of predicted toxin-antitoxin system
MKLLTDESVDRQIVERLRQDGHDVLYVAEMDPGISDDAVLISANNTGALLLTADKDFGELVFRRQQINAGVLLIRLAGLSLHSKAELVVAAVRDHENRLPGAFSVLSPGMIRIRQQPDGP